MSRLSVIILVISAVLYQTSNVESSNILTVFPSPSKSHSILAVALVKGLAKHGHNVTLLSPFPQKVPPPDYHDVPLTDLSAEIRAKLPPGGIFKAGSSLPIMLFRNSDKAVESIITDPKFQDFIKQDNHYDAIIVSSMVTESLLGYLAERYDYAPVIFFSTSGTTSLAADLVANPAPPSIIPDLFTSYADRMTFFERVDNTLTSLAIRVLFNWYHYPNQQKMLDKYLSKPTKLNDVVKNVSLVLSNSHHALSYPQANNPAIIEIGGFHLKSPKPLPKDLQDILDDAKDGAIFFSLGTNVRSADLPTQMKQSILESFAKLKMKVLWKWDEDTIPGLSKNVYLRKWLPQNDILAHPNVKLFITHGGLLSTTEAVAREVPLVGIPIFADQHGNIKKAARLGIAVHLDHANITTDSFSWAINEALNNPKYKENIQIRSRVLNDQMVPQIDKAVYWVEHVIRFKGAKHLQTAAIDLPLYQYLLLDVIAFLGLICILALGLIYFCLKLLIRGVLKLIAGNKIKKE